MALVFGTLLCRGTFKAKPTIPKATEIATLQEELGAWGLWDRGRAEGLRGECLPCFGPCTQQVLNKTAVDQVNGLL